MFENSFVKRILSMTLAVCFVLSLAALIEPKSYTVSAEAEPVLLANSAEAQYEQLTFSDFGVGDGEILTEAKWTSETKDGGLDEILFRGKYTFPAADQVKQFGNIYLGKADWWTIVLNSDSAGNLCVDATGATFDDKTPINLTATNPELQLRGREVEIDISVKYENTTSTTTDLKIGVWIDGVLSKGGYIYAKNVPLSNLTRCLHFYDADANSTVTVASVKGEITAPSSDVLLSESAENNYEKLTFSDFGVADGEILTEAKWTSETKDGGLDEILFRGKYTFPAADQVKQFGNIYLGKADWWTIVLNSDSAGNLCVDATGATFDDKTPINLTATNPELQLRGREVEIDISVKYENTTSTTTDLKIGVWIDGVLSKGGYIYAKNVPLSNLTRCLHFYDAAAGSGVPVKSVKDAVAPEPEPEPEPEDVLLSESEENNYEKLTFADFDLPDGDILTQGNGTHFVSNVLEGDLDEVLFQGKYTYPTMEASRLPGSIYLGRANWWAIGLTMDSSANIMLSVPSGTIENTALTNLTANNPDVQLRGQEVEIAISIKYENKTADKTDLKIGVWFDGVLQNGGYIIAKGVPLTDLTRCFHTYDTDSNGGLKVASVGKTYTPPDVLLSESEENNYEKLTFADFDLPDGDILTQGNGTHFVSNVLEGDLDEVLFQGKYTYPTKEASLLPGSFYLGRANWWAIGLTMDSSANIMLSVPSGTIENTALTNLTANNPDVQLRGQEVEIAISIKYENKTADKTDLKIGVWFDGVLQNGGYIIAKGVPLTDLTRCFHTYDTDSNGGLKVASVGKTYTPPDVLLSESEENNYEKLTFADFDLPDGDILTQGNGTHFVSNVLEGDLDEVLFQGKYTYPTKEASLLPGSFYLGRANWWAIGLTMDSSANIMLSVPSGTIENTALTNLTANNPDVQLRGQEVEIAISIKYENKTADKTDLKIGVWFDGVLQNGGYIIAKGVPLTDLTRCFHTYDTDSNGGLKVASVGKTYTPPDVLLSESEENNYEKLTFADFDLPDGDILTQGNGTHFVSNVLEGDLDEVLFQGKYTYPTKEASLLPGSFYLGRANWWAIGLTMDSSANIMLSVPSGTIENTALTNLTANNPDVQLRGQEVEIAISIKYENKTADKTDLKIGVWFDGVLQNGGYIIAKGVPLTDLTRCFHTYDTDSNGGLKVASVGKTYTPPDVLLSESEENNYEKLTFADFEIEDGNILTQGNGLHFVSSVALEGDLDEVLFQGKYTYPTKEASLLPGSIYLGRANWWAIGLTMDSSANIMLSVPSGTIENTALTNLTANNPNVQLRGQEVEIAISIKYENKTADKTDLKIGVWFDGVLQNGGYIIAKGVPLTDLTRCFHTYDTDSNGGLKVASVGKTYTPPDVLLSESEENNYEKLTFADFGATGSQILAGNNGEKTAYATLPGNLDGILFQGKYNFPGLETAKKFGQIYLGRADWWSLGLMAENNGDIVLKVISDGATIDDSTLCNLTTRYNDVQLRGEEVEIAISVKYENTTAEKTDLKIGVWVNGVLSKGKYIYARNVLLTDLVKCFHTVDEANGASVGVASVGQWTLNTLPVDFTDLTLIDGDILDGDTFTYGNFARIESLDKTLVSANVQFNTAGARLHLGCTPGAANGYSGLGLRLESNGTLVLGNELVSVEGVQDNELTSIGLNHFVFSARAAGVGDTFTGKSFLLQISTEFVDQDNDGEKDDIKLGVFFNGVLYCNNYIYILGEAQTLSTGVNFNGGSQGFAQFSSVRIQELTNADLGINKGVYTATVNGEASSESLNGTAITAEVTFGKGASIAYGKEGKGIVFTYAGEGVLKVSHVKADGTVVAIGEVKISSKGAAQLRTTVELIKAGEKTNLKLGVFVNGKLSGYKYFLVEDVDASVLTKGMTITPNGAEVRMGENGYETVTLRDFIIADKTRSDRGGRFSSYEGANYNGTAFSAVLGFSDETEKKNNNCFYVGGKEWAGVRVELDANGNLAFSFVHADGTQMQLVKVAPEDVGMETFQGKTFDYRVTFDVLEAVAGKQDALIGIYVNGVLCGGTYQLVKNVDAVVLERGLFSYVDKNGGSLTMQSTNPAVDFTIFGLTKDWKNTLRI